MAKRRQTKSKKIDNLIFKRTAASTKKVNIEPTNMRGGLRN